MKKNHTTLLSQFLLYGSNELSGQPLLYHKFDFVQIFYISVVFSMITTVNTEPVSETQFLLTGPTSLCLSTIFFLSLGARGAQKKYFPINFKKNLRNKFKYAEI
jgi:hypothetical protein